MKPVRGLLLLILCCLGSFVVAILIEGVIKFENVPNEDPVVEQPYFETAEERRMHRFYRIVFMQYSDVDMSEHDKYRQAKVIRLHWVAWKYLNDTPGVTYWLDHNSLLGWYREGRILPWDWTVTIGVRETDFEKLATNRGYLERHKCEWRNVTTNKRSIGTINCSWMQSQKSSVFILGYAPSGENLTTFMKNGGCTKGIHNLSEPCSSCPVDKDWYHPLNCSPANALFSLPMCVPRRTGRLLTRYYGSILRGANCSTQCCVGGHGKYIANPLLSEQQATPSPLAEYDPDKDSDSD
eukprot:TRINITY_DN4066_c0_g1_i4.p1 TRINITY_DN4066_c0_g1~~TRINITY_DN4066_c0_g1_i4.p1  ORF type:complete len:295 (+),score=28.09 TRINITY_DN4066_c0_g1_i4:79-963(+)